MSQSQATSPTGAAKPWILALSLNFLWINASEIFRYFALVMPEVRAAFPQIEDVAPMSATVFAIWAVWDTVLILAATGAAWLLLERFGASWRNAALAGTCIWLAIFGILWLGVFNMNLATPSILLAALPLSWVEMVVASSIVCWVLRRAGRIEPLRCEPAIAPPVATSG